VKKQENGESEWVSMSKKNLQKHLDFRSLEYVEGGKKKIMGWGKMLDQPIINADIGTFEQVEFTHCGKPDLIFPLWNGFAIEAKPNRDLIQPFLDHVFTVICGGNELLFRTEIMKDAWIFQHPQEKMNWATVLISDQGSGKNLYTDTLCSLWGRRWSSPNVTSAADITGDKCLRVLHNKKIVVCNELSSSETTAGRKFNWDPIKARITEPRLLVREMYKDYDPKGVTNVSNFFFVSNHLDSMRIEAGDRRFFVLEVSRDRIGDHEYFSKLFQLVAREDFKSALLSYFLTLPTESLDTQRPPETELKQSLIDYNEPYAVQFIKSVKWWRDSDAGPVLVDLVCLWNKYLQWGDRLGLGQEVLGKMMGLPQHVRNWVLKSRKGGQTFYEPGPQLIEWKKSQGVPAEEIYFDE
jgi:hypothetical protein